MSREVRRVPIDFAQPIGEVWAGYLMPDDIQLTACSACEGMGYSPEATHLSNLWYGKVPFRPEDNGSIPLTSTSPDVRALAEQQIARSPEFYGHGEDAICREAVRLATWANSSWSHHLNQDDVDALVAGNRLWDFVRTYTPGEGWSKKQNRPTPTAAEVNTWSLSGMGHDSCNAYICIKARCERERLPHNCLACGGDGNIATPEQRATYEAWKPTNPPTGDGWQLWETTSEGSPKSPVFETGDLLAEWMSKNPCGFGGARISLDTAMTWVHGDGWSPSMIITSDRGLEDGITFMANTSARKGTS